MILCFVLPLLLLAADLFLEFVEGPLLEEILALRHRFHEGALQLFQLQGLQDLLAARDLVSPTQTLCVECPRVARPFHWLLD